MNIFFKRAEILRNLLIFELNLFIFQAVWYYFIKFFNETIKSRHFYFDFVLDYFS